jgi:outer membrane biosynthesis protein TonB
MTAAERFLREAATNIPAEICARIATADKMSDADRTTIIELARHSLVRFQLKPGPKPEPKGEPMPEVHAKPKPEPETKPKPKAQAKEKS